MTMHFEWLYKINSFSEQKFRTQISLGILSIKIQKYIFKLVISSISHILYWYNFKISLIKMVHDRQKHDKRVDHKMECYYTLCPSRESK